MIIQVDKEGEELLAQIKDALLRGYGVAAIPLYNALVEHIKLIEEN